MRNHKYLYLAALIVVCLFFAFEAQAAPVSWDFSSSVLQPLQSGWSALVKANNFQATSTTAINTFPNLKSTNASSTNATTTNQYITSLVSKILKTDSNGQVVGAAAGTDYQAAGSYITALTGDVTASGPGSAAATLATVNSNVGSFTNGSFTVNAKGLITAASSGATPEVPLTFSTGLLRTVNTITNTGLLSLQQLGGGTAQTGAITFATTSNTTNGITSQLNITNTAGAFTFSSNQTGTLTVAGGGTGVATLTGLVKGNGTSNFSAAANGTDYTLTTAQSCTNQVITALTAAGGSTCSTVSNAMLANSTISGIALGGTLGALTATDSTITFSGSYTGATARTLGINLSNPNIWTGKQTFTYASSTGETSGYSSSTLAYFGTAFLPNLGTAAGSFLAVNASGQVIATTTPSGGGASLTGTTGQVPYFSGTNTAVGTSTIFIDTASRVGIGTTSPLAQLHVSAAADMDGGRFSYIAKTGQTSSPLSVVNSNGITTFSIGANQTATEGNLVLTAPSAQGAGAGVTFNSGSGKSGLFQYDGGGNMVFRNNNGAMFFDYQGGLYFRNSSFETILKANNTSVGIGVGNGSSVSTLSVYDTTASTGATTFLVQGGAAAGDADTNKLLRVNQGGTTNPVFLVQGNAFTGISSTTPGTIFSIGSTSTNYINLSDSATSTFSHGLNITSGCYAINGTCLSTGGSTYTATYPVTLTGSAFGLAFGTTTSNTWAGTQTFTNAIAVPAASIANASLTNSTISGVTLGGTLAALTATDSTLTFSGSYTGATARTVGLNLGNANTWSALQQFTSASTTRLSSYGPSYFGATATSTFSTAGILSLVAGAVGTPSLNFGDLTTGLFRSASNAIGWAISGVEKLTLNSTGLGVGSTSPSTLLSVGTPSAPGSILGAENTLATSTSMTIDFKSGNQQVVRLGTSATSISFSNALPGSALRLVTCAPGSTAGALTFTGVEWAGNTVPTQTTTANQCDVYSFVVTSATSTAKIFGAQTPGFQ